ncbi:unnamed protein product [Durusdinium trenchii]|uniref:Cyclic nucleotide-binding domain-containing protein n=1 Tax=Durusdinium trenchii TaxID=1381693 RepID=A0ABP0SZN6_9DINO
MVDLGGANKDILKRQLQILRKAPNERTPEDVKAFAASLGKTKFFQDLGENERMQVCRYLKLEGAPRDSTVFKQGDRGDKFYLILYGSVGVFITEVEAKDVESKESKAAPSAASGEAPQVAAQAHGPTSPASPAKPVRGGWAKLQKLVHNAVPPAVELELVEEAKEVTGDAVHKNGSATENVTDDHAHHKNASVDHLPAQAADRKLEPQEDVEVEELQPEEPQEDRKEAKRVTIAATGTQEGPTPSTEGHGGEAVPDRGDGKEYRKLQMNRSESRLSVKSTGSEHSEGEATLVRENSLVSQIQSIGAMAKQEMKEREDEAKAAKAKAFAAKGVRSSLMRSIFARPLFHLRGPNLIEVAVLSVGDCFGEVALQTDQPRAATVKTRSDAIFATLVREDYKAILHSQLQAMQEERQGFLRSIALLKNLPNIPNLAALMQRRVLCRHGLLINIGVPVMHMYMVFEGNFSLRGRIKRIKTEEKEKKGEPKAGTSGTSDVERRRRPSDLEREKEPKDKDKFDAKIEKQTVSRIVLSVMPPGSTYGLSHFLKGEREHLRQVICESSSGLVYTLFAKDVAAHLSQQERLQVVATASAEEAFFRQRCVAVGQLASTRQTEKVKSVWPPEKTLLDKVREYRDVFNATSIYSPEGCLRAIGTAFLEDTKCQEAQLRFEKVQTAKQCVNQTSPRDEKTRASETPADMSMLRPWHMQELAENVYHACHDVSNPGALAADLQTAVEKDIRMARRAQNQFLVPLVRRPFNPLEDEPLVEASEARAQPSEPVPTRVSLQNPKRRLSIPSAWKSEPSDTFEMDTPTSSHVDTLPELWRLESHECSKSKMAEEDCTTLPCDFFSARLMELCSPRSCDRSPREVPSACSTRLPCSRGSRTSRMSGEKSPWPSIGLQLDSVFISKSSRQLD